MLVPVLIRLLPIAPDTEGRVIHAVTPCLLPELHLVHSVTVCGPRYEAHTLVISGQRSCVSAVAMPPRLEGDATPRKGTVNKAILAPSHSVVDVDEQRARHPLTLFVQRRQGELSYESDPAGHERLLRRSGASETPHTSYNLPPATDVGVRLAVEIGDAAELIELNV